MVILLFFQMANRWLYRWASRWMAFHFHRQPNKILHSLISSPESAGFAFTTQSDLAVGQLAGAPHLGMPVEKEPAQLPAAHPTGFGGLILSILPFFCIFQGFLRKFVTKDYQFIISGYSFVISGRAFVRYESSPIVEMAGLAWMNVNPVWLNMLSC